MSEASVSFFSEDTDFMLTTPNEAIQWVSTISEEHDLRIEQLNFIFCSDNYLLQINKEHLDHNYYTDIITFDLSDDPDIIEGDIFISVDRVRENALSLTVPFIQELHRVIIHGVLHLIGYNDKNEEEKKVMREKEDACLSLLKL